MYRLYRQGDVDVFVWEPLHVDDDQSPPITDMAHDVWQPLPEPPAIRALPLEDEA